jgi:hypothetical protein
VEEGAWWRRWIQVPYFWTSVNATMCPPPSTTKNTK